MQTITYASIVFEILRYFFQSSFIPVMHVTLFVCFLSNVCQYRLVRLCVVVWVLAIVLFRPMTDDALPANINRQQITDSETFHIIICSLEVEVLQIENSQALFVTSLLQQDFKMCTFQLYFIIKKTKFNFIWLWFRMKIVPVYCNCPLKEEISLIFKSSFD